MPHRAASWCGLRWRTSSGTHDAPDAGRVSREATGSRRRFHRAAADRADKPLSSGCSGLGPGELDHSMREVARRIRTRSPKYSPRRCSRGRDPARPGSATTGTFTVARKPTTVRSLGEAPPHRSPPRWRSPEALESAGLRGTDESRATARRAGPERLSDEEQSLPCGWPLPLVDAAHLSADRIELVWFSRLVFTPTESLEPALWLLRADWSTWWSFKIQPGHQRIRGP